MTSSPTDLDTAAIDEDVLSDVEQALNDLTGLEIDLDSPTDLERVRKALPKEPQRARLTHASLPPALRDSLEYVEGAEWQSPYWRRSRERSDPEALSPAELRHRIAFTQTQMENRDVDGVVTLLDSRAVPQTAVETANALSGEDFTESVGQADEEGAGDGTKILQRIKKNLPL